MGQYHLIANLSRTEYVDPRAFEEGQKLTEFGFGGLTMAGFAALLSSSNNRGFGDLWSEQRSSAASDDDPEGWLAENGVSPEGFTRHVLGRWAGDRIAIIGDYWKPDDVADWGDGGQGGVWSDPTGWINVSWWSLVAVGLDPGTRPDAARLLSYAATQNADDTVTTQRCYAPRVSLPFAAALEAA